MLRPTPHCMPVSSIQPSLPLWPSVEELPLSMPPYFMKIIGYSFGKNWLGNEHSAGLRIRCPVSRRAGLAPVFRTASTGTRVPDAPPGGGALPVGKLLAEWGHFLLSVSPKAVTRLPGRTRRPPPHR